MELTEKTITETKQADENVLGEFDKKDVSNRYLSLYIHLIIMLFHVIIK
jgi:hypothetical protein